MSNEPMTATEQDMATRLGMTYAALRNARNRDVESVPPHLRIGGRIYYRLDRLQSWLDAKTKESVKYRL